MRAPTLFQRDLEEEFADPEFRAEFERASAEIAQHQQRNKGKLEVTYDRVGNVAYIYLPPSTNAPSVAWRRRRTVNERINIDYNSDGEVIGIEILFIHTRT